MDISVISDSAAPSGLPWDLSKMLREVQLVGLFAEPARAQELCTPQTAVGIGPSFMLGHIPADLGPGGEQE